MSDLIGQSLGRYHILEQLGEGGMATVYKAYDTRLERDVAIKVIRRGAFPNEQIDRILKRFEREAKALARLSHSNIVKVHDFGEYDDLPYIVMEYLPGGTLKQLLKNGALPWQEATRLLLPVARALDFAHRQGIVHRDIKPSNILITAAGDPMLTDFGIAKILESEDAQTLTGTGIGVGTPEYMAPEQWTGQAVQQSDIYSLGVVLYELVTGRKPFTADTPAAILLKQANDPLPRPKKFKPDLPDGVEKIIIKALAKKPEDRYQNMEEFTAALEALLSGQAKIKKPTPQWEKREAEKSHQPEHEIVTGRHHIEDHPTLDAQLPAKGKPVGPVFQATGTDKIGIVSPEIPPRETIGKGVREITNRKNAEKAKQEKIESEVTKKAAHEMAKQEAAEKVRRKKAANKAVRDAVRTRILSKSSLALKSIVSKAMPFFRIMGIFGIIFLLFWVVSVAKPDFLFKMLMAKPIATVTFMPSPVPSTRTMIPSATNTEAPTFTKAPTSTPVGGGHGKIIFLTGSYDQQQYDVYSINSDGTGQRQLTFKNTTINHPVWSPDGKKLLSQSKKTDSSIYIL